MKKRPQPNQSGTGSRTMAARTSKNTLTVSAARRSQPGREHAGRHKKLRIAAIIAGTFLFVCALAIYLVWRSLTGQIHVIDPVDDTIPSEFNIPTESLNNPVPVEKNIINILLLGVDTRDPGSFAERTDSMMILTIDQINGKIKLTSLQRDMLVYVPGRSDPVKINSANALGGPALTLRVVNETLRLSLSEYMIVNMRGMEQLIDLVGGVMIDVDKDEIEYLNQSVLDENNIFSDTPKSPFVTKSGPQLLNGRQAVAFARIRHLDNDYKRMERQRTVMQAMFKAFMDADLITKGSLISEGLGLITTNISVTHLTEIGLKTLPMMNATIDQLQIPIKNFFTEGTYKTQWVNLCDFNGMIPQLQEFIFGKTYAFDPVKEIPGAPNSSVKLPTSPPTKAPTTTATTIPTTKATTGTTNKPTTETLAPTTTAAPAATVPTVPTTTTTVSGTTTVNNDPGKPTTVPTVPTTTAAKPTST